MSRHPFRRITIIGVGLIGGSLGMSIREHIRGAIVTGYDKREVLRKARRRGAIDHHETSLVKAVWKADLVILAVPTSQIRSFLPRVARVADKDTVVTDVGSVKHGIVADAANWFRAGNFVGGHPMAGAEASGIDAAHPLLLENCVYILTPGSSTLRRHARNVASFVEAIGARPFLMDPAEHDAAASALSHLPQLAAVALMNVAGSRHQVSKRFMRLGAGGFRDLTRIASSSFGLWSQILSANREEVARALELLEKTLAHYRREISAGRSRALAHEFRLANSLREQIPRDMKGFVHRLAGLEVFVRDRPGNLARLAVALARNRLNIKDIELMKVREGTGGTFRIFFESENERRLARKVLQRAGFKTAE